MVPGSPRSAALGARGGVMTVTDGALSAAAVAAVDSCCRRQMRRTMPTAKSAARAVRRVVVFRLTRAGAGRTGPPSNSGSPFVSSVFISALRWLKRGFRSVRLPRRRRRLGPEPAVDDRHDEKRRDRGGGETDDPGAPEPGVLLAAPAAAEGPRQHPADHPQPRPPH